MDKTISALLLSLFAGIMIFGMINMVSAEKSCILKENKCCVGENCSEIINVVCAPGYEQVVQGCDEFCNPITHCVDTSGNIQEDDGCTKYYQCSNGNRIKKCELENRGCICRGISSSECYSNEEDNTNSDCKNLYWIDNDNKDCSQQQFCGMFMYYGLQTFESKEQCEKALNGSEENWCTQREDITSCPRLSSPVCGCYVVRCEIPPCPIECKTYDNSCFACSEDSDYWKEGKCKEEKTYFNLSNGRKAEIKIMPETASERARERLGELNFTIELKEVGQNKTAYELTGNKEGRFLGIFKIMARETVQVDAETGDVVKIIKPWWAFLATRI